MTIHLKTGSFPFDPGFLEFHISNLRTAYRGLGCRVVVMPLARPLPKFCLPLISRHFTSTLPR